MNQTTEFYDVVIVGGGVGGIYTGYRLLSGPLGSGLASKWAAKDGGLKVAIFEGSDRIGGRILSAIPPAMPNTVCEIGGMRFVSSQPLISSLVLKKLKLATKEQKVDEPENIAYLRGKQFRQSQLTDASVLPYDLSWGEQQYLAGNGSSAKASPPSALIAWAFSQLLPNVSILKGNDLLEYLKAAEIDGIPLYKHGFWNLLSRTMSSEALAICKTTVGYDCLGGNANALDLCREYFDFTPTVKYYLLQEGYDAVPWTLQQQFEEMGGTIFMNSWMTRFEEATLSDGTRGVRIFFSDDRPPVLSRSIVLAMPQRSLNMLQQVGPVMDPTKCQGMRQLMASVQPIALYKLFLTYPFPWWRQVGVTEGRSLTDIPVRQCYYWASESTGSGDDTIYGVSALMAYNDADSADYWRGLAMTPPKGEGTKPAHLFLGLKHSDSPQPAGNPWDNKLRENWDNHPAPRTAVAEMHRQLCQMHGVTYAPEPLSAAFMDWSVDPYGAGVHFWNPGYKSWEVLEQMTQPNLNFPCYVCGEAYSTNQTWAEGALQTSEIVLQKRLGLPSPAWVSDQEPQ